jgi:hypothetical protein
MHDLIYALMNPIYASDMQAEGRLESIVRAQNHAVNDAINSLTGQQWKQPT